MRRGLRWLAPAASSGAVAAYALVPALLAGHVDHPSLPTLTAAQLLTKVQAADVPGLSGTVKESSDLGLPTLPAGDGGSALSLLSGSRTLQVAQAGRDLRVAVLGSLQEQDLVINDQGVWTYDSTTGTATHHAADAHDDASGTDAGRPDAGTPQQSATDVLAAIDPTTTVTVDRTAKIAGRSAYTLVLTPKQDGTLVGRVEIAVDAATGVPLRTAVYAAHQKAAAFEAAYTQISFAVPGASTFASPDAPLAAPSAKNPATAGGSSAPTAPTSAPTTTTIGQGWTAVTKVTGLHLTADQTQQLDQVSNAVPGGRLITTSLLSLLVTPGGTAYVGAVPGSTLEALAASTP